MKKLFLLIVVLFSSTIIINAQNSDPTLPPGQTGESGEHAQQSTPSTDFFIFGSSGSSVSNGLVLNGIHVPILNQGWYVSDYSHTAANSNYICGDYEFRYYRNFHAIDLSNLASLGITPPITSAVLKVVKYESIPNTGYAVWDLHSVLTPYATINQDYLVGSPTGQTIYNDLGNGSFYGNGVIDGSLSLAAIIETTLNSVAIADINAAIGSIFVIGGRSDNFLPNLPPTTVTNAATTVTGTSATLNGTVNANSSSTDVSFYYGTTSGNLNQTMNAVPFTITGTTITAVSADLTGLIPGETYFFQVSAENIHGAVVYGLEMEFTTTGVTPSVPLSSWPIYAGILLIAAFIVIRYRRNLSLG